MGSPADLRPTPDCESTPLGRWGGVRLPCPLPKFLPFPSCPLHPPCRPDVGPSPSPSCRPPCRVPCHQRERVSDAVRERKCNTRQTRCTQVHQQNAPNGTGGPIAPAPCHLVMLTLSVNPATMSEMTAKSL